MKGWKKKVLIGSVVAVLVVAAALLLYPGREQESEDADLRAASAQVLYDDTAETGAESAPAGGRAHITVAGTGIDYDLAQATDETGNDYYLNHDYDGNYTTIGCPFVDHRTSLTASHALVYAHGIAGSTILFSQLKQAHSQEVFDGLGEAVVTLEDGTARTYEPAMALSVDETYQPIQTFSFAKGEMGAWLDSIAESATAKSPDLAERCASAKHVLTLVTCTSRKAGQPLRTLTVFTSDE